MRLWVPGGRCHVVTSSGVPRCPNADHYIDKTEREAPSLKFSVRIISILVVHASSFSPFSHSTLLTVRAFGIVNLPFTLQSCSLDVVVQRTFLKIFMFSMLLECIICQTLVSSRDQSTVIPVIRISDGQVQVPVARRTTCSTALITTVGGAVETVVLPAYNPPTTRTTIPENINCQPEVTVVGLSGHILASTQRHQGRQCCFH